jgi:uncharacterized protein
MDIVTQFPHKIIDEPDMGIMLSDNCRLSARVFMPEDAIKRPLPAILEYLPYRKRDGTIERDEMMHKYFAGCGYVVLRVDMRGSGESQGLMLDEYSKEELSDCVEVINWIAEQSWCDGNVGMMGKSWGGFNCIQVAMLQPAPLKAIISGYSTVDRYADDIHYKGGCLLNENLSWSGTMLSYSSRPPDPSLVGDQWRTMWLERLNNIPFYGAKWMQHPNRDEYWKHGSLSENYDCLIIPTLCFGGWADNYMNTVSNLIENVKNSTVKGIVGPWVHQYPHTADPSPQIGFLQEALRWWDKWLKGAQTGVEKDPNYRIYLQDSIKPDRKIKHRPGQWIVEKDWPSTEIKHTKFYLSSDGVLGGDTSKLNNIIKSPTTCGFGAGSYFPMSSSVPEQSGDQSIDDAYSLCFDHDPVKSSIDIVGRPKIKLTLKSDNKHGHLCVRLCDVSPDRLSTRITYGLLNLTHRSSHENPTPIPVNEEFSIELELDQIAYRLLPGNKLRISLSNAYWPLVWPVAEKATLTLIKGELLLPVRPESKGPEYIFPKPECASPWSRKTVREPYYSNKITTDQMTDAVKLEIFDDYGIVEDNDHGLQMGTIVRETFSIHPDDPLCASGHIHWTQTLARNEWNIRTEIYNSLTSDKKNFYMTAKIKAFEAEKLIFEKDFKETIKRSFH